MPSTKTPKHQTYALGGLPPDTTTDDIKRHFKPFILPGYAISLGPIVNQYSEDRSIIRSRSTTVTFFGPKTRGIEEIAKRVVIEDLYSHNGKGKIILDKEFYGLNIINEHQNPTNDFYFVPGLGGHGFRAWVSETPDGGIAAWPRDFLPKRLASEGISGSFATLSCNMNVIDNADPTCTISTAAENILDQLRIHRRQAPDRPMYFVCHSLAGLVVCQALILSLSADSRYSSPQYASVLRHPGTQKCLVKGIVFMGTPFNGTLHANQVRPFLELFKQIYPHPVNDRLVSSIQDQAVGLSTIRGEFRHIMEAHDIKVLVGCETQPVRGTTLVTDRDSAIGALGDVPILTINRDHIQMVKFSHQEDPSYRYIEAHILHMVRGQVPPVSAVSGEQFPIVPNYQPPNGESSNVGYRQSVVNFRSEGKTPPLDTKTKFMPQKSQTVPVPRGSYAKRRTVFENDDIDEGIAGLGIDASPTSSGPSSPRLRPIVTTKDSGQDDHSTFSRLNMFDTVIIIDDTGSMQLAADSTCKLDPPPTRWSLLERGLQYIVDIVTEFDTDGIDIQFLKNVNLARENIVKAESQTVLDLLIKIEPLLSKPVCGGGTFFKKELQRAINPRIGLYRTYKDAKAANPNVYVEEPKSLNLLVFTDGEAEDDEEVEEYLIKVAKELDLLDAPLRHIGVQFIQVGDDEKARVWLQHLDDDLKPSKGIRDMIDTTPFNDSKNLSSDAFNEILKKILLGAVTKKLDEKKIIEM